MFCRSSLSRCRYKGSTLELLKVAPNKGSVIKPAGKARSAAEFVTLLRGRPSRNDLTQLADHLDPSKPMHVSGFLASFIEAQGVAYVAENHNVNPKVNCSV